MKWYLFSIILICLSIIFTVVMWFCGAGFYLTYVPAGSEDGIVQYSPVWALAFEVAAGCALFMKQLWGALLLFGPAAALSFDIYPAWAILGSPDISLKFHIIIVALLWLSAITGALGYKYLNYE